MKRGIIFVFTLIALLCMLCGTACAHEVPDMNRKGTISVTMSHDGERIPGGTLTVFRVGEVCEDDGNYGFRFTDDFVDCGASLEHLQSSALPETLAEYVKENGLKGRTEKINEKAVACFDELELGLYLVVQYKAAEGYYTANPFLVSVPSMEEGHYIYEVDASPKVDPITERPAEPTTELTVTKPGDSQLPQTGQLNWPVPLMTVSGLALFAAGWILRFGRKKEPYEK